MTKTNQPNRKPDHLPVPPFFQVAPGKGVCFRCGLGLRWTGLNSWKCWSWKMFLGNHWRFMSLVTSWKKYWLNDSIIMLMVFNRRNACKHFSFSIPLAPWDWYLYLHGWLIFNGTCRYIYSSPIGAASGNMSWSVSATAGSRVETLGRAFSFQCLGIQDVAPVDLGEQKISVGEWKKVRFTNLGLVDEWDGCQHLPRGAK